MARSSAPGTGGLDDRHHQSRQRLQQSAPPGDGRGGECSCSGRRRHRRGAGNVSGASIGGACRLTLATRRSDSRNEPLRREPTDGTLCAPTAACSCPCLRVNAVHFSQQHRKQPVSRAVARTEGAGSSGVRVGGAGRGRCRGRPARDLRGCPSRMLLLALDVVPSSTRLPGSAAPREAARLLRWGRTVVALLLCIIVVTASVVVPHGRERVERVNDQHARRQLARARKHSRERRLRGTHLRRHDVCSLNHERVGGAREHSGVRERVRERRLTAAAGACDEQAARRRHTECAVRAPVREWRQDGVQRSAQHVVAAHQRRQRHWPGGCAERVQQQRRPHGAKGSRPVAGTHTWRPSGHEGALCGARTGERRRRRLCQRRQRRRAHQLGAVGGTEPVRGACQPRSTRQRRRGWRRGGRVWQQPLLQPVPPGPSRRLSRRASCRHLIARHAPRRRRRRRRQLLVFHTAHRLFAQGQPPQQRRKNIRARGGRGQR